ncbi:MAG TPA: VOC family protein [Acidimicrobiales bacterium]
MATRLCSVVIDAPDPSALGRFWSEATGWPITLEEADEVVVEPPEGEPGIGLVIVPVDDPKVGKNRVHLDLTSQSAEHQAELVERVRRAGATPVDIGQGAVPWVVLADPAGNEFCVLEPQEFYAGVGPVAAVVVDTPDPGTLAEFWTVASGWPVVHRGEIGLALSSPDRPGPFLEFLEVHDPKVVKNRVHLDVAPEEGDDHAAEVERLRALGADDADIGQGEQTWVVLADPDGNEFCVLTPRSL